MFVRGWLSHLDLMWEDARFRSFIQALARHFTVVRYDTRGNGLSERSVERFDLESLLVDLEDLIDQLGFSEVVLHGASFGGPIAMLYAARHPRMVRKLILEGTFARGSGITTRARQITLTRALQFFPEMGFLLLGRATHPEPESVPYRRPEVARQMVDPPAAAQLYRLAFRLDVVSELASIVSPTLVLHRRGSQAIPFRLGAEVATLIPGARLAALDGCAHNAWEGDQQETLREIGGFLGVELWTDDTPARDATPPGGAEPLTGRYRMLNAIGAGGMGVVFRAEDLRLHRPVAIKVLNPIRGSDDTWARRFRREVAAASALNHPNICTIHDTAEVDGRPCIVMELLEGHTLAELGAEGRVDPVTVLDWAIQISAALSAAHGAGVVHRDIKPANLFVTSSGFVKVLDFGLAKFASSQAGDPSDGALTARGSPVGTLAYMSPEQARGEELDPRTDLFSLGVVLYRLTTGAMPFQASSTSQMIEAIGHHTPASPLSLNPALPAQLDHVIMRLLEKDAGRRHASADELCLELKKARASLSTPVSS